MLFEKFEVKGLAHYSYAVGCPGAGEIAIVDPQRDVDVYLDFARRRKVDIAYVLETHIHADFASGARELAFRTGAEHLASGYDRDQTYQVAFPHSDLLEGQSVRLGTVRIEPLHTPGHTPEHLSFLVFDEARSKSVPMMMLSGDFLFVGSLGRPDLLGEDAKLELANKMFDSVRTKIRDLPDGLEIHPGHGAGSMCGSGMGGRPESTLGFERIANPYLNPDLTREEFVSRLLGNVPPFPDYYRRMKEVNSAGPALLEGLPGLAGLDPESFRGLTAEGAQVIDLRGQAAFGGAHIPDSFGIGFGPSLATWAAWVVSYDRPIALVPDAPEQVEPAVRALVRVGLDDVRGYLEGGVAAWTEAGFELRQTPQISVAQLADRLSNDAALRVLDVRGRDEWRTGRIPGSVHIQGGELPKRLGELPAGPLAVVCASGYRSTVAASVLERAGVRDVVHVTGGMNAWTRSGLPVVRDDSAV